MKCSCCGNERDITVALQCHDDIVVCRECIGWLRQRSGMVDVTPIFPITDLGGQPWGMREFTLTDPDGNYLRIGQAI